MSERQFAISGRWALAADSSQWLLQRRSGQGWQSVSFVGSTKGILARCMREKDCPPADAERLLAGLPSTFEEWAAKRLQTPATANLAGGEVRDSSLGPTRDARPLEEPGRRTPDGLGVAKAEGRFEWRLYFGGKATGIVVRPDEKYPGLFRVHWPDRPPSDLTNLTRAKDAAVRWAGRGGSGGTVVRWDRRETVLEAAQPLNATENAQRDPDDPDLPP